MNSFDFLIIGLLAVGAYKGYKRGLIKSLGGLLGWVVSLVIALSYNQSFANYLDKQFNLVGIIGEGIIKVMPLPSFSFEREKASLSLVAAGIEEMGLPGFLKGNLLENVEQIMAAESFAGANISELIAFGLAGMILKGLAFLVLFIAAGLIVKVVVNFLSGLLGLTLLGPVNRLAGLLLGLIMYGSLTAILFGLASPFIAVSAAENGAIAGVIHSSFLFSYLMEVFGFISSQVFGLIDF
ncbi:MAG: CvpA family protein [Bacillota bacterium]